MHLNSISHWCQSYCWGVASDDFFFPSASPSIKCCPMAFVPSLFYMHHFSKTNQNERGGLGARVGNEYHKYSTGLQCW